MTALSERAATRIALLALPETTPATVYALHEVFAAAGVAWEQLTGERAPAPRLEPVIVARRAGPADSPAGLPLTPQLSLDEAGDVDAVIATDLALAPDDDPRGRWRAEAAFARRQFAEGALACSVCTGSVFLAEAGLLDGREATTHWGAASLFRRHYPQVRLHPERLLCPAGPEHRLVTAGGSSAWAELALHLVARFCGPAEAVRIAKIFLLGDHGEGQLPFAAVSRAAPREDAVIARCQAWLAEHYREPNPVQQLVALSGLPERSFKRRFKAATGYAPLDYAQALRIEEAKQLLETTGAPTDRVAAEVGYDDPGFFRRLFKRRTGVTPARYRRRYKDIGRVG